ncbi:MAG TPA: PLP-dependent aminotransferase family protein [Saprospiraceae bacterium]|nr:PLP-dependent aminotransferase family protein [Saprospiraceae bacterium]HMP24659.1 PLP-dependent aminotransferase family protein [Saprospiraceae bacterium]
MQHTQEDFLYQQVADRIEQLIRQGTLKTGDKLLSVRMLSKEQGISMSTAYQAYTQLEAKGLIEARPKSGYYVRLNPVKNPPLPRISAPEPVERDISLSQMIATVFKDIASDAITQFSVGAPSLELLPAAKLNKAVLHALRHSRFQGMNYEHIQGNPDLRSQVARLAFNWQGNISPDEVVITSGCMEALITCLKAVTQPGDTVAVESPTYFAILQALESLGLRALEVPTCPKWGPELDFLENALHRFNIRACVFIPNFNNPLGSCMPDERKRTLVEMLAKRRIPLIEDDIYGEMYFGEHRPKTCKTFDREGLVLQCGSFSKSLAPGYRVGWAIPGQWIRQVTHNKLIHSVSSPTLQQAAIAWFLENGRYELHLKRLRKALHTQCLRYLQAIQEYFPDAIRITRPAGGFVLWIELPPRLNAFDLYRAAIREGISFAPGQIFSTQGSKYLNFMRISFGRPFDDNVERGIQKLGQLVHERLAV